ncbi:MAG: beta-mannosidase [Planctomycetaceae bacterium]|nr:beta-mannosidase [Planctomycetaceae bacterium]
MNDAHRRTRRIHDDWRVARTGGDPEQGIPPASLPAELTATVPGVIHHDLIAAGVIPHPDRGDGEQRQKWVGRSDWTWSRSMGDADLPAGVPRDSVVDLVFDSIDTVGRVCLGDEVLGEVSNQFHRHRFRIDRAGIEAGERLEVRLRSPLVELDRLVDLHGDRPVNADGDWGIYSYLRKASCSFGWDWGPQCPSLGIPAEVRIECWRDARIEAVRPLVTSCNERLAVLETHLDLAVDAVTGGPGSLRATVSLDAPDGRVFTETVDVRAKDGVSAGVARLRIEDPQRWWPRGRGDQPLHRLRVELRRGEELLDVVTRRIGLRLAALETGSDSEGSRFQVVVNGETIFCQGANWIPEGLFPGTASADSVRARIVQAVDAGFNMLRVWGGGVYESDDFYDVCDELGVMVWQDFMFACATYPEEDPYPASIEREAREQVGRLSSHPSIVIWCGGNENVLAWRNWGWKERMDPAQTWGRRYFTELLPAVVAELDPSRPFLPDSPWSGSVEADPNDPDHGDRHTWDLKVESVREMVPRFVSEFGHQGPPSRTTIEAALGPAVFASESPEAMAGFAGRQRGWGGDEQQYDRWLEEWFSPATDLDGRLWRMQLLQARATTFTYEWLRLNQPRCGGALVWQLNDAWTGHSWSLIDVAGRVKPAWWAARTACRPRLLAFSVGSEGLEVAIANGDRESWNPHVRVRRVDFTGREIVATELELNASGFGVDRTPIDPGMSMPEDASMEYLVAEADGERACWFYGKDAWISMPRTSIDLEVFEDSGGHRVDLHARDLVRDFYVDVARVDPNATVDLNLLTFLPGESASLRLEGLQEWPLERIRNRFRQGGLISAANDCIMPPR